MRGFLILIQAGLLTLLAVFGANGEDDSQANCPADGKVGHEYCAV